MIKIDFELSPNDLKKKLELFWELSGEKIKLIDKKYDPNKHNYIRFYNAG